MPRSAARAARAARQFFVCVLFTLAFLSLLFVIVGSKKSAIACMIGATILATANLLGVADGDGGDDGDGKKPSRLVVWDGDDGDDGDGVDDDGDGDGDGDGVDDVGVSGLDIHAGAAQRLYADTWCDDVARVEDAVDANVAAYNAATRHQKHWYAQGAANVAAVRGFNTNTDRTSGFMRGMNQVNINRFHTNTASFRAQRTKGSPSNEPITRRSLQM